ncbi:ABC transporter ATP-binding protein [bacterium]|nr:ABC transporter ATP-binding protein [bacterium]
MSDFLISTSNLHKSYQLAKESIPVLNGINIEVTQGEIVAIVGSSGAGKSTLLHILGGLDVPTEGSVLFRGKDIFDKNDLEQYRSRTIGFVFQFHHLMSEFTAMENVMMPALIKRVPQKQSREEAKQILRDVGLANRLNHMPSQLSGGEQQRVAIARALINEPDLILADEPTGNLDSHTGEGVFQMLEDIVRKKNKTMIIVTHNEKLSERADRIIRLIDGMVWG